MWLYELLQLTSALKVDRLRLVVNLAVLEDLQDVITKLFTVPVLTVAELLLDCL